MNLVEDARMWRDAWFLQYEIETRTGHLIVPHITLAVYLEHALCLPFYAQYLDEQLFSECLVKKKGQNCLSAQINGKFESFDQPLSFIKNLLISGAAQAQAALAPQDYL